MIHHIIEFFAFFFILRQEIGENRTAFGSVSSLFPISNASGWIAGADFVLSKASTHVRENKSPVVGTVWQKSSELEVLLSELRRGHESKHILMEGTIHRTIKGEPRSGNLRRPFFFR
jgi:hypothetical protein